MINCDENTVPVGTRVLLKKLVNTLDKKYGNIILPHSHAKNCSLGVAQVIRLGEEAKRTGLSENDYVLYDYYSVFSNMPDYVLTNAENIILQITEEEAEHYKNNYVIK
jgi:hypothetical protein